MATYAFGDYTVISTTITNRCICAVVDGVYGVFPHLKFEVYHNNQFVAWFEEPAGTDPKVLIDQVAQRLVNKG